MQEFLPLVGNVLHRFIKYLLFNSRQSYSNTNLYINSINFLIFYKILFLETMSKLICLEFSASRLNGCLSWQKFYNKLVCWSIEMTVWGMDKDSLCRLVIEISRIRKWKIQWFFNFFGKGSGFQIVKNHRHFSQIGKKFVSL
jgi:hypothetical protein